MGNNFNADVPVELHRHYLLKMLIENESSYTMKMFIDNTTITHLDKSRVTYVVSFDVYNKDIDTMYKSIDCFGSDRGSI